MFARSLILLLAAVSWVYADLKVTSPAGGASLDHDEIQVELSGATGMTILVQLMIGGSKADGSDSIPVFGNAAAVYSGSKIAFIPPVGAGPLADFNAYYLKVTGTPATGPPSYSFSQRFMVKDMAGQWPADAAIKTAAQTAALKGNSEVPADVAGKAPAAGNPAASIAIPSGSNIAFTLQTGTIKFAPMQSKPGTAITATNTAPLYPISAWSVYTTGAPIPIQISTQTPSAIYSVSSRENTGAPASKPTGDMAKFLARWAD